MCVTTVKCSFSNFLPGASCFHAPFATSRNLPFIRHGPGLGAPVLCVVPDVKDFSNIVLDVVLDDVGRRNQFASTGPLSGPTQAGNGFRLCNAIKDGLRKSMGCFVCPQGYG